jgi:hypothetical protein
VQVELEVDAVMVGAAQVDEMAAEPRCTVVIVGS